MFALCRKVSRFFALFTSKYFVPAIYYSYAEELSSNLKPAELNSNVHWICSSARCPDIVFRHLKPGCKSPFPCMILCIMHTSPDVSALQGWAGLAPAVCPRRLHISVPTLVSLPSVALSLDTPCSDSPLSDGRHDTGKFYNFFTTLILNCVKMFYKPAIVSFETYKIYLQYCRYIKLKNIEI
jgi:hypothetical protein